MDGVRRRGREQGRIKWKDYTRHTAFFWAPSKRILYEWVKKLDTFYLPQDYYLCLFIYLFRFSCTFQALCNCLYPIFYVRDNV